MLNVLCYTLYLKSLTLENKTITNERGKKVAIKQTKIDNIHRKKCQKKLEGGTTRTVCKSLKKELKYKN